MLNTHLVGSVNLTTAEEVFQQVSAHVGGITRIPDGETDRPFVGWMMPKFLATPGITSEPGGLAGLPRLGISPGFEAGLSFEPFGFGEAAGRSYATFSELKRTGVIAPHVRMQVCVPSPLTIAATFLPLPQQEVFHEALLDTLSQEVAAVAEAVPHFELAIQFDLPGEIGVLEGAFSAWYGRDLEIMADAIKRLASAIPADVQFGFHLCYGDPPPDEGGRGKHWVDPKDAGVLTGLANAILDAVDRPVNWIHMPVPMDRDDMAYFEPLTALKLRPETTLFLGLLHDRDGVEGAQRRIAAAGESITGFGVSTECGLGRVPREDIEGVLTLFGEVARAGAPA